jgi:hypothetical protein
MKSLLSIALMILAAFVGWLFFQSAQSFELREKEIEMEQAQSHSDYTIFNDPDGMTYLLNKKDGTTWRWYRNMKDGNVEDEGWISVNFNVLSYVFADAQSASQSNKSFRDALRKIKANEGQPVGGDQ